MFKLKNHRLIVLLTIVLVTLSLALTGCNSGSKSGDSSTTVVIGATAEPHATLLEYVKPKLAEQGINLDIKVFTDYNKINQATAGGDLDANFFQHVPYLEASNAGNNLNLVSIGKVHIEPMGLYSQKVKNVSDIKDGDQITVPNDPTNCGRALALLEKAGLIKLKEGVGILGSVQDIVDNPKNLRVKMVDAAQTPRTLSDPDVVAAVINGNYALEFGLNPVNDSIFLEDKDSPYANIIATTPEKANDPGLKKLVEALNSPDVKNYIEENYKGAIVPAF